MEAVVPGQVITVRTNTNTKRDPLESICGPLHFDRTVYIHRHGDIQVK